MVRFICVLLASCLVWLNVLPASSHLVVETSVNAVIGDISYYQRFGRLPTYQDDEVLRIRTHLSYVEKLLRSRVPSTVSTSLMPRRQQMLDLLHTYHQQGVFPSQDAYEGRRPNFIDEQGRLCAVGYLIAQTAGIGLAREIDKDYSYAYLPEMKSSKLAAWAEKSGLTIEELAMIQPRYVTPEEEQIGRAYGLGFLSVAAFLTAVQLFLLIFHTEMGSSFSPEYYADVQTADIAITFISALLLPLFIGAAGVAAFQDIILGMASLMLGGLLAMVIGIPNLSWLIQLDDLARQQPEPVSIGWFQTPDRQNTWGLHASLSF